MGNAVGACGKLRAKSFASCPIHGFPTSFERAQAFVDGSVRASRNSSKNHRSRNHAHWWPVCPRRLTPPMSSSYDESKRSTAGRILSREADFPELPILIDGGLMAVYRPDLLEN